MNSTLFDDRASSSPTHITLPTPDEQHHLTLTDRLSLRIGLWLLLRHERRRQKPRRDTWHPPSDCDRTEREAMAIFFYDINRGLR